MTRHSAREPADVMPHHPDYLPLIHNDPLIFPLVDSPTFDTRRLLITNHQKVNQVMNIQEREDRSKSHGADLEKRIKSVTPGSGQFVALATEIEAWHKEAQAIKSAKINAVKAFGGDMAPIAPSTDTPSARPASPLDIPVQQYKGLFEAASKRLPSYRVEFDGKPGQPTVKSPFSTGGFTAGGLPPVLLPELTQALPYEPDRLFEHFISTTAPSAGSVEWIQHTGNTNPAAATAELGTKPDLGLQLTTRTTAFTKIAALASISMEALQDFSTFMSFVPAELFAAIVDAETDEVVNGSGSGAHMRGILNTSGTLTRAIGADTPIDCLRKAFNDLRVGSSFARADLVAMHPTTWADLQLQKATTGLYLLNPNDPNALGDLDNIFGVKVITNTHIVAGTAIVVDTTKAVLSWTRMGMTLDVNSYGTNEFSENYVTFRAEERVAIGVQRPTAINIVTGLPAS
ncbi:phage major capsid protein [Mycolicibacterium hodleri]|uniref:Phage major capsid protein n=1 Tax=Mycolicibacterium hodleri TaxID=49897 RepID=A0A502E5B9_9MYCO|nr:phage major capsid protein [Mycolicibacterium hodleri]TPG31756.1 phage major capsid protein [Mycolicibacterium hodleri]